MVFNFVFSSRHGDIVLVFQIRFQHIKIIHFIYLFIYFSK